MLGYLLPVVRWLLAAGCLTCLLRDRTLVYELKQALFKCQHCAISLGFHV